MDRIGPLVRLDHGHLRHDDFPPDYGPPPAYRPPPERVPYSGHRRASRRTPPLRNLENVREYRYDGLDDNSFRVFQMDKAASFDAEVSGKLVTMDMRGDGGPPRYNALSYVWGDSSDLSASILCSGCRLRVTPGLKTALKYIRDYGNKQKLQLIGRTASINDRMKDYRHFVSRPLWVDAICINQTDFNERSQQVSMMGKIYHYSLSVIVWLGEPDEHLRSQLRRFSSEDMIDGMAKASKRRRKEGRKGFWGFLRNRKEPEGSKPPGPADLGALLGGIVRLPWFQRRWVLQEMFFAGECDMLVGTYVCSRLEMQEMLEGPNLWDRALPLRLPEEDCNLLTACWLYRNSKCSDPRDYVYALTNMSSERIDMHVDYNKSVRTVFFEMVAATILRPRQIDMRAGTMEPLEPRRHRLLQMLAIASCQPRRAEMNRPNDIEAWMPDWTAKIEYASKSHEVAVKTCMSGLLDERSAASEEDFSLPLAIEFTRSGHGYLWVQAHLLQPVQPLRTHRDDGGLHVQSYSQDKLERALTALLPVPRRERDCLWVAYLNNVNHIIGFTLRAGSTRGSLHDRQVYRMQSCFVIRTNKLHHEWRPPTVFERLRRLRTFAWFSPAEFYLE